MKDIRTKNEYKFDADAAVRSLHWALTEASDFSSARQRLHNMISQSANGSLQIFRGKSCVNFYSDRKYLSKKSNQLYVLARKRYYITLLKTIEQFARLPSNPTKYKKKCDDAFAELEKLIRNYAAGNLQLDRILLSRQQYNWYHANFKQKRPPDYNDFRIPQGNSVRSKSEQNIGYELDRFAVPCHYEHQLHLNVQRLVSILEAYDSRTGCITLHPDYTMMLADGSILYWEHEGLILHLDYRKNALERIGLMRICNIPDSRIIQTIEAQANDRAACARIIQTRILPYLWF